jgi:hypothetical protein
VYRASADVDVPSAFAKVKRYRPVSIAVRLSSTLMIDRSLVPLGWRARKPSK